MTTSTGKPRETHWEVVAGLDWHWEHVAYDTVTGRPMDFTTDLDRYQMVATIRDVRGLLLATLSSEPGADGTITGQADGVVAFDLPATFTATLPVNTLAELVADPRPATWWSRGAHPFDMQATDTVADYSWPCLWGLVTVRSSIAGGS